MQFPDSQLDFQVCFFLPSLSFVDPVDHASQQQYRLEKLLKDV
jgi:hypothetical protein